MFISAAYVVAQAGRLFASCWIWLNFCCPMKFTSSGRFDVFGQKFRICVVYTFNHTSCLVFDRWISHHLAQSFSITSTRSVGLMYLTAFFRARPMPRRV